MKTIVIQRDESPESPREWCNLGTMACEHGRYNLGDEGGNTDLESALSTALSGAYERRFSASAKSGYGVEDSELSNGKDNPLYVEFTEPRDRVRALELYSENEAHVPYADRLLVLPLYLYDHSGITMSTSEFSCPWDSGLVGWIFVTYGKAMQEMGVKRLTEERKQRVLSTLRSEVETYDQFLTGSVYGFTIYEHADDETPSDGEHVDSCWGFYSADFGEDYESNGMSEHWPENWSDMRIMVDDRVVYEPQTPPLAA